MYNPTVIFTKQDKFRIIMENISRYLTVSNYFRGVDGKLEDALTTEQEAVYKELESFYYSSTYRTLERNSEDFQPYVDKAYLLIKEIFDIIPKPVTFQNGVQALPFEENYGFVHNPEHNGFNESSRFTLNINGMTIQKHDDKSFTFNGLSKSFTTREYDYADWLYKMRPGIYTINGIPFKLWARPLSFEVSKIIIMTGDLAEHPLLSYITEVTDEEDYEVSCTSCGDGGCIHCSPNFFM